MSQVSVAWGNERLGLLRENAIFDRNDQHGFCAGERQADAQGVNSFVFAEHPVRSAGPIPTSVITNNAKTSEKGTDVETIAEVGEKQ
ncbi:hypothetical protein K1W69_06720 [Hoeflea sp. WL0058]|uniref:Uncharacterized protein n=1 Tax=Flavimaribacter sediminis TaxID=2865987 RepID=A0AAE3CZ13_9HYPH|nr:hypothetical protein [Flavimaribacter sediminis]MBW8636875.1 hypothetical protein [Flavimaribacter sediminis]